MNHQVRLAYERLYAVFCSYSKDKEIAWDRMLQFLAADNSAPMMLRFSHSFEWLHENSYFINRVMTEYNPDLLRSDYYDHLGEIYLNSVISKPEAMRQRIFLLPHEEAERAAGLMVPSTNESLSIYDPRASSGRLLMAAHKQAPNAMLFGADPNLDLVRIALTNFCLHDITALMLHADCQRHETRLTSAAGEYNWQYANRWYSSIDELKPAVTLPPGNPHHN